jgi:hypothetical protein
MLAVSYFYKVRIVILLQMGMSHRRISEILAIPKSTVNSIIKNEGRRIGWKGCQNDM